MQPLQDPHNLTFLVSQINIRICIDCVGLFKIIIGILLWRCKSNCEVGEWRYWIESLIFIWKCCWSLWRRERNKKGCYVVYRSIQKFVMVMSMWQTVIYLFCVISSGVRVQIPGIFSYLFNYYIANISVTMAVAFITNAQIKVFDQSICMHVHYVCCLCPRAFVSFLTRYDAKKTGRILWFARLL